MSSHPIRWGVLGVAKIAVEKVIPAMQRGTHCTIAAIASRDAARARDAAGRLGISKSYGSYDDLLADPDIDAIYNPLPNHLHVPLTIRAAEAGKHVLCEKPLAITAREACALLDVRSRTGVVIGEAFMVATHPQWLRARAILDSGEIGAPRSVLTAFSYFNRDPHNIRNNPDWGGGALLDIGCYPVFTSRFLLGEEPVSVQALIHRDPDFQVDVLTSGLLRFPSADSIFTCGTQQTPYQRTQIFGEKGRIELEIPFNAPPDRPCRIVVDSPAGVRTEEIPTCDQYTIQGDAFSLAIRNGTPPPVPIEDSIANLAVLDALFQSAASGRAETPDAGA